MTIQNATARQLMYEWHGGQYSALYQAASSGLVLSFTNLALDCNSIAEPDKAKLLQWIAKRQSHKTRVVFCGREYAVLPWVSRSYFDETQEARTH